MKKKNVIIYAVQILLCYSLSAQSVKPPAIVPASPEASALAKYINYPVKHSSGLPEINIALYDIKVGDLSLPISLSYHASGIKLNENAGIVGLGWTLNAEPSVSRSIKGLEDEKSYLRSFYSAPMDYRTEQVYKMNLAANELNTDEEPDEFYYKLLNKSGGFYIGKKPRTADLPKFILHPYAPISIENTTILNITNNSANTINAFNIVDEMGVRYNFSNIETSGRSGDVPVNTCWKATSITSAATSQIISFQYQPGNIERIISSGDRIVVQDSIRGFTSNAAALMGCANYTATPVPRATDDTNGTAFYKYISNGQWVTNSSCYPQSNNGPSAFDVNTVRIKEINFSGGKVVFDIGGSLNSIKIYTGTQIIKEFRFNYELSSNEPNTINRSLLKSIDVLDKDGISVEKYQFDYYNFPGNAPALLSKSLDYWGYYNGAANDYTKSLVPRTIIATDGYPFTGSQNIEIGNANREPDFANTRALTLMSVTFPTGGKTTFQYQPNQYKENNQIKNAGGLRIYKIVSQAEERIYTYGSLEDGTGSLRVSPTADTYSSKQIERYFDNNAVGNYSRVFTARNRTYYANALTDLFYSGGCPVFYDFVTEYITDGLGNSLGKTEYQYAIEGTGAYGGRYRFPNTTLIVDLDWEWKFGQLVSKKVYKGNRALNNFSLISKSDYEYITINSLQNSIYVGKTYRTANLLYYPNQNSNPDVNAYDVQSGSFFYTSYTIPTGAVVLSSDTGTVRNGENEITTVTSYTYGNAVYPSPTQIKTTGSEGVLVTINNKYTHDLLLTGNAESARQKLISDFRVGTLLEQSWQKGTDITKTRTDYGLFNGRALPATVLTNTGNNFSDEARIVYEAYDVNGNLRGVSIQNNNKVCYIWGYNNLYPIAKVENATYAQIEALAGFGTGFTVSAGLSAAQENTLRTLPNAMVTTYTYIPFVGVSSITDPKGDTITYTYDSFGRLEFVKDKNGDILSQSKYHYKN